MDFAALEALLKSVTALPDGWEATPDGARYIHKVANVTTKHKPSFVGEAAATALFQAEKTLPDIGVALQFIRRLVMQSTGVYMCHHKAVVGCMTGAGWADVHTSSECGSSAQLSYIETNRVFSDALTRKFKLRKHEISVFNENPCWNPVSRVEHTFYHVVVAPGMTSAAWASQKTADMFVYNLSILTAKACGMLTMVMLNPAFTSQFVKAEFGSRVDVPCGDSLKAPLYAVPMESFNRLMQHRSLYVSKCTPCDVFLRGECSREYLACGGFPKPSPAACEWAAMWCVVELRSIWPPLPPS